MRSNPTVATIVTHTRPGLNPYPTIGKILSTTERLWLVNCTTDPTPASLNRDRYYTASVKKLNQGLDAAIIGFTRPRRTEHGTVLDPVSDLMLTIDTTGRVTQFELRSALKTAGVSGRLGGSGWVRVGDGVLWDPWVLFNVRGRTDLVAAVVRQERLAGVRRWLGVGMAWRVWRARGELPGPPLPPPERQRYRNSGARR